MIDLPHGGWHTIVEDFKLRRLRRDQWKHVTHLVVALAFLLEHDNDLAAALCHIRPGFILINVAHGNPNSTTKGYHETITVFWTTQIRDFITKQQTRDFDILVARLVDEQRFFSKGFILEFYNENPWNSTTARGMYVPPDR